MAGSELVEGNRTIEVSFYDAALGGTELCAAPPQQVNVTRGAFRINVSSCEDELEAAPDTFVQLVVGADQLPATGAPRPRVGAVPYAVQAISAVTAANLSSSLPATAVETTGGTSVQARIDDIETKLGSLEAGPVIVGTTTQHTGNQSGLAGRLGFCRAAFGTSAFPCTGAEALRSIARGQAGSWTTNGTVWVDGGFSATAKPDTAENTNECQGWTSSATNIWGPGMYRDPQGVGVAQQTCNGSFPILCCAYQ
ncbi:MAG: hypothetical protein KC464_21360 [Myxococcales bacterium]|nr:hypothetical protein [Myxococcales bacterium]